MAKKWYIEDDEQLPAIVHSETQPEGYSLLTNEATILSQIEKAYKVRELDGSSFYNSFRSRLMREIELGNITPTDAFLVESHLKELKDNLITGNWLTAQSINASLPLSGIYDQDLKDEIQEGIDLYVANNY